MTHSTTSLTHRFLSLALEMLVAATCQRRTAVRALLLTCGLMMVTGRSMLSRALMVLGLQNRDWSAAYRLFDQPRIDLSSLQAQVVAHWARLTPARKPLVVVVDGTQLPRTGRKMPGKGFLRAPRTPVWNPGIHDAQRFEGVSGLTPPTEAGDCRTIPLWFAPAPPRSARPWPGCDPRSEWEAAMDGLTWLRGVLASQSQGSRRVVVVADGAYTGAGMWRGLPSHTTLLARCAKNRALFALPDTQPERGRKRRYGLRGPIPQEQRAQAPPDQTVELMVRGKLRHIRAGVSGPWLVKPAPDHPLFLITIQGISRQRGSRRHARDPLYLLVNAVQHRSGTWELPDPLATLLLWAWQRWEVETMHRDLKSGCGLGDQQQWSPRGALAITQWVVWVYAVMLLAAMGDQRQVRHRSATRWYRGRRWTPRDVQTQVRQDLWQMGPTLFDQVCREYGATPVKWTVRSEDVRTWLTVSQQI